MRSYIKGSAKTSSSANEQLALYDKPVSILEPFTNNIDLGVVLRHIKATIPQELTNNFEGIYVGKFTDVPFNALYKDGAIYVTNDQDNEVDLLDDIVHEIAHSLEEEYQQLLYGDNSLESEFLAKRRSLYYLLDKPTLNMIYYMSPSYQPEFDEHLYKELGYDYLRNVSSALFYSPYAITSLREYWANGFENYILGDKKKLKELSPILYNKIKQIFETIEEY